MIFETFGEKKCKLMYLTVPTDAFKEIIDKTDDNMIIPDQLRISRGVCQQFVVVWPDS